jgi:hypothetical protein
VWQFVADGQLKWGERFACACGHGFEAKDAGLPTPAARAAILLESGTRQVWLDQPEGRAGAVKVLEVLCGLPRAEAEAHVQALPCLVYEGTPAEVDFVARGLERVGVSPREVTLPPPSKA